MLYHQEQYWKSEAVELNRNTIANLIIRSSMRFEPLWKRMQEILLNEYMIHADETPLRVIKHNGQQVDGQSGKWLFCSGKYSQHKMSSYFYHAKAVVSLVEHPQS